MIDEKYGNGLAYSLALVNECKDMRYIFGKNDSYSVGDRVVSFVKHIGVSRRIFQKISLDGSIDIINGGRVLFCRSVKRGIMKMGGELIQPLMEVFVHFKDSRRGSFMVLLIYTNIKTNEVGYRYFNDYSAKNITDKSEREAIVDEILGTLVLKKGGAFVARGTRRTSISGKKKTRSVTITEYELPDTEIGFSLSGDFDGMFDEKSVYVTKMECRERKSDIIDEYSFDSGMVGRLYKQGRYPYADTFILSEELMNMFYLGGIQRYSTRIFDLLGGVVNPHRKEFAFKFVCRFPRRMSEGEQWDLLEIQFQYRMLSGMGVQRRTFDGKEVTLRHMVVASVFVDSLNGVEIKEPVSLIFFGVRYCRDLRWMSLLTSSVSNTEGENFFRRYDGGIRRTLEKMAIIVYEMFQDEGIEAYFDESKLRVQVGSKSGGKKKKRAKVVTQSRYTVTERVRDLVGTPVDLVCYDTGFRAFTRCLSADIINSAVRTWDISSSAMSVICHNPNYKKSGEVVDIKGDFIGCTQLSKQYDGLEGALGVREVDGGTEVCILCTNNDIAVPYVSDVIGEELLQAIYDAYGKWGTDGSADDSTADATSAVAEDEMSEVDREKRMFINLIDALIEESKTGSFRYGADVFNRNIKKRMGISDSSDLLTQIMDSHFGCGLRIGVKSVGSEVEAKNDETGGKVSATVVGVNTVGIDGIDSVAGDGGCNGNEANSDTDVTDSGTVIDGMAVMNGADGGIIDNADSDAHEGCIGGTNGGISGTVCTDGGIEMGAECSADGGMDDRYADYEEEGVYVKGHYRRRHDGTSFYVKPCYRKRRR